MAVRVGFGLLALACATPANAQPAIQVGFQSALRACEAWVLEPATWGDGLEGFSPKLGLGKEAGWVKSVDDASLPPKELRVANHYLRISSSSNAGYVLVVSD